MFNNQPAPASDDMSKAAMDFIKFAARDVLKDEFGVTSVGAEHGNILGLVIGCVVPINPKRKRLVEAALVRFSREIQRIAETR